MKIIIGTDKDKMGLLAATQGAHLIREAIETRGYANIILATGASQFEMLSALAKDNNIQWNVVTVFHLDEYIGLRIDHPASFRGYLWNRFHKQLPLPVKAFHYLNVDSDPESEVEHISMILNQHPIDVAFIGIGENGHLAFNDPPCDFMTDAAYHIVTLDLECRRQQCGEGWFPSLETVPAQAISMTVKQIMKCNYIICTAPDERKARAIKNTVEGDVTENVPASILQTHDECTLYTDPPGASLLKRRGDEITC